MRRNDYSEWLPRFSPPWSWAVVVLVAMTTGVALDAVQSQGSVEQLLAQARSHYDNTEFASALPILDGLVGRLQAQAQTDRTAAEQIASAYEMRARVRIETSRGTDWAGAIDDMKAMLLASPDHRIPKPNNPRLVREFDLIRKAMVGEVILVVNPADAATDVDGRPIVVKPTPVSLLTGEHPVRARRTGYKEQTQKIQVLAGAPVQTVTLTLERESATVAIVSVPPDAEVYVDGKLGGKTPPGPAPLDVAEEAAKAKVTMDQVSGVFVIEGLTPETSYLVEVRKGCYVKSGFTVTPKALNDYGPLLKVLQPATGTVVVTTPQPGASVSFEGKPAGKTPATIENVCEGDYGIEVSADYGRFAGKVTVQKGQTVQVPAQLKPAFGLLSVTGVVSPPSSRRQAEVRTAVERRLGSAGTVSLVSLPANFVYPRIDDNSVEPGWLSFDLDRKVLDPSAKQQLDAATRLDVSKQISTKYGLQGVATATLDAREGPNHLYLSLLASGSAHPDILEIVDLENPEQVREVARRLEGTRPLFRPTLGLLAVDVADVAGAVIIKVDPDGGAFKSNLKIGHVITGVNGQAVNSASALAAALANPAKTVGNDRVSLTVTDQSVPFQVSLGQTPRLVSMTDKTVLFNKLILDFRAMVAGGLTPNELSVVRLNLAVSLLAVGNFADARKEIEQVKLPSGPGVSKETVAYLYGVCLERLGEYPEADRQFALAGASTNALITEDGELVAELVRRRKAPGR